MGFSPKYNDLGLARDMAWLVLSIHKPPGFLVFIWIFVMKKKRQDAQHRTSVS